MTEFAVFQCPNCNEFINNSLTNCKFCNIAIDHQTALIMATLQEKVNAACNHAGLTRNLAGTMILSFFMRYIPIIGLMFAIVFLITLVGTPIQLFLWQAKYSGIQTNDPDYVVAKRNILFSLIAWVIMFSITAFLILANLVLSASRL
ncbi:MAG: hypothetical protein H7Z37_02150 [Pyrinomonadaceae bacterium]|nr:hypothetical protein [Pyrinomonadaceae bacterium]